MTSNLEQLQALREKLHLLSEREASLSKKQRKVRDSMSSVTHQIDLMEKQYSNAPIKACGTKRLRGIKQSVGQSKAELRSILNEDEETKELRYLYVSNGCVISLLDLKQSKDKYKDKDKDKDKEAADYVVPPLPEIATLKLIEKQLPVSMSLFKWRSDVYMIGGHDFPTDWKPSYYIRYDKFRGYNLYQDFCFEKHLKGTSRTPYRLSLAKDDDGTLTLTHSKAKRMMELKTPKIWPIVEEIQGQIHVLDYFPSFKYHIKTDCDWIFSHEVLDRDGRHHRTNKPMVFSNNAFINSHIVIGNRIYAIAGGGCVVFDAKDKKWEHVRDPCQKGYQNFGLFARQVWRIIDSGIARCVGEFPVIISSRPLYVIIAVVGTGESDNEPYYYEPDEDEEEEDLPCTHAVAYLLTSEGEVVCSQRLDHFFEGPMRPDTMAAGTMIVAGKKTMCSIISGTAILNGKKVEETGRDYVFINTFTVEMLSGAASDIRQLLESDRRLGAGIKKEFVRVVVKDRYIFTTIGPKKEEGDFTNQLTHFVGVQACFL